MCMGCDLTKDKFLKHISRKVTECDFCGVTYHNACLKRQMLLKNSPEIAEKSLQEQFIEADKIKLKLRVPYRCTRCKDWLSLLESNAVKDLFLRRG